MTTTPDSAASVALDAPRMLGATDRPLVGGLSSVRHGTEALGCYPEREREKFWHRQAAYHTAAGRSAKEIAEVCEVGLLAVYTLQRQEWFQKNVLALMDEAGAKDVMALFKAEVLPSMATMRAIRDDDTAPKAVRLDACKTFIDRVYGKAKERVEHSEARVSDPVAEVARLEAANASLREQQGFTPGTS